MAGRPLEFDTEIAVDLAVELFWEQGYEATSISDLVEYTGVGRQSLYNVYGNKRSLFLAVLDRYSSYETEELALLRSEGGGLAGIHAFFRRRARYLTDGRPVRACLMVNAAMELSARDEAVADRVARYAHKVRRAFERALARAEEAGEITLTTPLPLAARTMTNVTFGLAVTAKTGASQATLEAIAATAVDQLTR